MEKKFDIMVAGHVCFDLIPQFIDSGDGSVHNILRPGKLVNVGDCMLNTGGPVSNTGIGIKQLGHNVCFCACIGDDEIGDLTARFLTRSGNAEGIRVIKNHSSSYTIVIARPNVDRIFLHHPGTNNLFSPEYIDPTLINHCRHFHFGYPPLMKNMYKDDGKLLVKVFQMAKDAGAITSCDMSLPDLSSESGQVNWEKILENILPYVDIFLPSLEEAFFMLERESYVEIKNEKEGEDMIDWATPEDYSRLAGKIIALGARMTSLKTGHRGFYFKTGSSERIKSLCEAGKQEVESWSDRELWCPAFKVNKIASATGSGDSSISGFLAAFIRSLPLEKCLKYACILGWQNLQVLDAVSGIKSWKETTDLLKSEMAFINPMINSSGWKWIDDHKLWAGADDPLTKMRL